MESLVCPPPMLGGQAKKRNLQRTTVTDRPTADNFGRSADAEEVSPKGLIVQCELKPVESIDCSKWESK